MNYPVDTGDWIFFLMLYFGAGVGAAYHVLEMVMCERNDLSWKQARVVFGWRLYFWFAICWLFWMAAIVLYLPAMWLIDRYWSEEKVSS